MGGCRSINRYSQFPKVVIWLGESFYQAFFICLFHLSLKNEKLNIKTYLKRSWLFSFDELCCYSIFAYDINDGSPAWKHISVASWCQYLVKLKWQFFSLHVRSVICLAYCHQLFRSCTCTLESFDHTLRSNRVITAKNRLSVLDSSNDWLDDPTSESLIMIFLTFFRRESMQQGYRKWQVWLVYFIWACIDWLFVPSRLRKFGCQYQDLRGPW